MQIEKQPPCFRIQFHIDKTILCCCCCFQITGSNSSESRPGFFFNGGIHAREWISPATVIYMAAQVFASPYSLLLTQALTYVAPFLFSHQLTTVKQT